MNSNINDEYHKILDDIDENVTDVDEAEYVKGKIYELSMMYLDEMKTISEKYEDRINAIAQKQNAMDEKLDKMQKMLSGIEHDIYDMEDIEGEESFEFEITCPYCNNVFEVEVNEEKKDVRCPECNNMIELDWDGLYDEEAGCGGSCSHCHHSCDDENDEEDEDEDM